MRFKESDPFVITVTYEGYEEPIIWTLGLEQFEQAFRGGRTYNPQSDAEVFLDKAGWSLTIWLHPDEDTSAFTVFRATSVRKFVEKARARATPAARQASIERLEAQLRKANPDNPQ